MTSSIPSISHLNDNDDVIVAHMPVRMALRSIWLHPRSTLAGLAYANPWSWIGPIGFALLVFYARIFALALLRDPFLNGALLGGIVGILIGWPLCTALLYGLTRVIGGRPNFTPLLVMCAWVTLPLTLRSVVQVIYMALAGRLLSQPGLSGLLIATDGPHWLMQVGELVLGRLDLFTLWHLGLLALAVNIGAQVSVGKALLVVALYAGLTIFFAGLVVLM